MMTMTGVVMIVTGSTQYDMWQKLLKPTKGQQVAAEVLPNCLHMLLSKVRILTAR